MTPGKRYNVLRSPHFTEESRVPFGESFIGNGSEVEIGLPFTQPHSNNSDKYIWRVSVSDIDSDGLTDAEEHQFGSNTDARDTDNDDINEYQLGTNLRVSASGRSTRPAMLTGQ